MMEIAKYRLDNPKSHHFHTPRQWVWVSLLFTLILVSGCEHRHFVRLAPQELRVVFDWQAAPQAQPEQMSLYFFPVDPNGISTGEPIRFDLAGREGGTIKLEVGTYHVIALNSDVRGTYIRGKTFEDFHITTNENPNLLVRFSGARVMEAPRAGGTAEQKVVEVPDIIYSDRTTSFEVQVRIEGQEVQELVLYPKKTTSTIEVKVEEVKNHQFVASYGASLTGLANSILLSQPLPSQTKVTVPFSGVKVGQGMHAKVETFGASRLLAQPEHKLVVYAIMNSGEAFYEVFDVTEQVQQAPDPLHIFITIPLLSLPDPIFGQSPQVTVTEWEVVHTPISM